MRNFLKLFLPSTALLLGACASQPAQKLAVERSFARSTLEKQFLGGRRIHRFTPILTDDMVITANSIDGIVAYDRTWAREQWRMHIQDGIESGATLYDGILYFGAGDGFFYAIKASDGKMVWSYPLKAEGLGKPAISGDRVFVLGGNNVAHALDAKTGKLVWIYNRRDASNLSIRGGSQPVVQGDVVYIGFSDGYLVALNRTSGNVVWEVNLSQNKRFRDVDATPVLDGDLIYISSYDGKLYALQADGGKILWTVDEGGYDEVLKSGKTLFLSSTSGKILAVEKATGRIIWSKQNPKGISTAPVLWRNVLLVGEMSGALRFLDGRTGEYLSQFEPGRGVTSKPMVDKTGNEVYFMSADANLYALKLSFKKQNELWPWESDL